MKALAFLHHYIGPVFWALLPISILTLVLVFYILFCLMNSEDISDWVEILLANFEETATVLGLLGSVLALAHSFNLDGGAAAEIRERMFFILSTGFWSTVAGVIVSLEASFGLVMMKKT